MPKSPKDFVDFSHVKKSVSIVQILERYALTSTLRQNGDSFSGPCPLHNGENPTHFRVSISKNCWNCFGKCKRGGNVLDFVALKESVSVRQAALLIQQWFGLQSVKPNDSAKAHSPIPRSKSATPDEREAKPDTNSVNLPLTFSLQHLDKVHPYLAERGLTAETIDTFGLGFCAKGILANHIAIPIHNGAGDLVAYAGRWPGEPPEDTAKYKLPQGFKKSLELFNLHRALTEPADKPLVIVEGFFDAIKLHQHGCRKVVALMGSTMSTAQEDLIREHAYANALALIALDEDEAGQADRDEMACRLSRFCFVKVHQFDQPGTQPEHLSAEQIQKMMGGLL